MSFGSAKSLAALIGCDSVSEEGLAKALAYAARRVSADGVREDHEAFGVLQEYYAAGLLEMSGQIQGALVSKSVADVSESYQTSAAASAPAGNTWFALYYKELRSITGKKGFIV